jgi:hypothetical protein
MLKLKALIWRAWTSLIWLRIVAASCEHGNEPSGFIKCREFLE